MIPIIGMQNDIWRKPGKSNSLKQKKIILSLVTVFVIGWFFLSAGVPGHITLGDSGELALAGATLGVPHSPGYPVFSVVNRCVGGLLLFGNEAYRQNLTSVLLLCAALALLGWLFFRLSDGFGFIFFPLVFLFSPLFRHQAVVTEVFPLAFFWTILIVACGYHFSNRKDGIYLLAFLFGIGLAIHQTLVLMYPGILYFFYRSQRDMQERMRRTLPGAVLFFAVGLSVHLFIYIRAHADPVLSWEDPQVWSRFWGLLTRERYGFFQLAQGSVQRTLGDMGAAFLFMKEKMLENFGWLGMAALLFGSLGSLSQKEYRRLMVGSWLMILLSGPFFFWMADVAALRGSPGILDRFVLLPLIPVAMIIGLGFLLLWSSRIPIYRWAMMGLLAVFLVEGGARRAPALAAPLSSSRITNGGPSTSLRWDLSLREMGLNTLRQLPPDSVLLSDRADELEFVLAYLIGVEKRRPDVKFIDCNAGVSKSIYGDDYYRIWGEPRLQRREKVEGALIENNERPVFYATVDPSMVNIYREPWGFLFRAWRLDQIADTAVEPFQELMTWRFISGEKRGRQLSQSLINQLAAYLFDGKKREAARDLFGLVQRLGGPHRDEQMGYLYQKRHSNRNAAKAYQQALESGAHSAVLYSNYGALLARTYRISEAVAVYEKGLRWHPASVPILYNLSTAYWQLREWGKSADLLEAVLRLDPRHEQARQQYPKAKSLARFTKRQNAGQNALQ